MKSALLGPYVLAEGGGLGYRRILRSMQRAASVGTAAGATQLAAAESGTARASRIYVQVGPRAPRVPERAAPHTHRVRRSPAAAASPRPPP